MKKKYQKDLKPRQNWVKTNQKHIHAVKEVVSRLHVRQPATMCNSPNCHCNLICQSVARITVPETNLRTIYFRCVENKVISNVKGKTNSHELWITTNHSFANSGGKENMMEPSTRSTTYITRRSHLEQNTHSTVCSLTFGRASVRVCLSAVLLWQMKLRMIEWACLLLPNSHINTHTSWCTYPY